MPRTFAEREAAKDAATTRRAMHFALVADKLDLSSSYERAAEVERIFDRKEATKRKYNFCVVYKLVYVTQQLYLHPKLKLQLQYKE